ncbi:hypothetical protein BH11MYX2_BH11MYX2_21700 [soil metagenome]
MATKRVQKPAAVKHRDVEQRVEAAVLAAGPIAVVRIIGEETPLAFRSRDALLLVPGQLATLVIAKRWSAPGMDVAEGHVEFARIDISRLGLEPLALDGPNVENMQEVHENYVDPSDPYTALWQRATSRPREVWEFDGIAWGAFPGADPEENLGVDAVELHEAGDAAGARELLHAALVGDLRCLDAHAHLGAWLFDRSPERALVHYEIGTRIGELSAPESFDGLLPWGLIYNRPFLRCLHGYALCLWRLRRIHDAKRMFERMLALNPVDNQGARFCWSDICAGGSWEEMDQRERRAEREMQHQMAAARRQARSKKRVN